MARDLQSVWLLDDGSRPPDVLPPVTVEQLDAFKARYGLDLPMAMRDLYQIQNGGFSLRYECIFWPIECGRNDDMTTLAELASSYHQDDALSDMWRNSLGDLARVVVYLGDGHFYYVLNYNDTVGVEPTVWMVTESSCKSTKETFGDWLLRH